MRYEEDAKDLCYVIAMQVERTYPIKPRESMFRKKVGITFDFFFLGALVDEDES